MEVADFIKILVGWLFGCIATYFGYWLKENKEKEKLVANVNHAKMEINYEIDLNWVMIEELVEKINCNQAPSKWSGGVEGMKLHQLLARNNGYGVLPIWHKVSWDTYRSMVGPGLSDREFMAVSSFYILLQKLKLTGHNDNATKLIYVLSEIYQNGKPVLIKKPTM